MMLQMVLDIFGQLLSEPRHGHDQREHLGLVHITLPSDKQIRRRTMLFPVGTLLAVSESKIVKDWAFFPLGLRVTTQGNHTRRDPIPLCSREDFNHLSVANCNDN